MGAALVRGVQRHMMACAKHYACNSMENMRFKVNVKVSERTLREVYLPHFKRCVDEGVASIMSAYNQVNGEYCGHNAPLLRRILKEEWGFKGFVVSDFIWGVRDGEKAIQGGMDVEMPRHQHMSVKAVTRLVKAGKVSEAQIDEAALRHIRTKMHFARVGIPEGYPAEQLCCRTHTDLAREAAEKSIVLLKNNGILPLDGTKMKKVAVFGKLANTPNTGDHGSSNGAPPYVITPLEGLTQVLSAETKLHYNQDFDHAAAQDADACIVVVGYTHKEEGEYMSGITKIGGDRSSLSLPPRNIALIQAVASANPRSVVVLEGGSAIITEEWRQHAAAILMAWYPGMEGGNALAGILFGKVNPSGKLPCVFPKSTHQLPYFDRMAEEIDYGYWHGYRLMERKGHAPAFHFGFGLSYTTFSVNHLQLEQTELKTNQVLKAKVHLQNTGTRDGAEIVQVYVGSPGMIVERPIKDLKGFQRIHLKAGESCWVDFSIDLQTLAYWDDNFHDWLIESGEYILFVGTSADPQDLLMAKFTIQIPS
jgi:beta-glucosidase